MQRIKMFCDLIVRGGNPMDDASIIELYWQRAERAIAEIDDEFVLPVLERLEEEGERPRLPVFT